MLFLRHKFFLHKKWTLSSYIWESGATESKKHKYALFEVKKYGDYEFEV